MHGPSRGSQITVTIEPLVGVFAFLGSLVVTPRILRRLAARGFTVEDRYKEGRPAIVTHAGLLSLVATMLALAASFLLRVPALVFMPWTPGGPDPVLSAQLALFTIGGYGIVGAIDDRHSLSHIVKAAVPLSLGLPAAALALARAVPLPLSFPVIASLEGVATLSLIPFYILVVANLINMHSGFNGLQSGLSLILLGTILARVTLEGAADQNIALFVVAGSVAAFYPFNRYPAKAIEGNVGSFLVGAAIAVGLTTNGLFWPGVVMLAPHILDFSLFAYARGSGRPFIKFGMVRQDGTIEAPYPYKLKFVFPFFFRLTERQTVRWLYILTLVTCLASFLVPKVG